MLQIVTSLTILIHDPNIFKVQVTGVIFTTLFSPQLSDCPNVLNYTKLASDKQPSLLCPLISYEENEVL
jgi:hypothetical protein